jgi:hypothetical protein
MPWRGARFLRMGGLNRSLQAVVRELPIRALIPLGIAIFCLFALLGPVIDLFAAGTLSLGFVLGNALVSGFFAIGYAFGSLRRNWVLFYSTMALQLLWTTLNRGGTRVETQMAPALRGHLAFDGVAIIMLMVGGYTCFLWFMNVTAARYIRIRTEMDLAHEIHQVLVPVIDVRHEAFEFYGVARPSGEVGGDLVDLVAFGAGWVGYVADVSGHGVSSGVVMGMFKSALRMRLRQPGSLGDLLGDLNGVLYPLKSSAMYVTASCVRGGEGHALEYAVAGHLPILLVRGDRVEEVTTPQIPVGMFEDYAFTSASLVCEPDDLLVLLTDGLIEVFDARDRELGLDAIKTLLAASASRSLREIADAVVARARAHGKQLDDQTLLLIRRL